MTPSELPQSPTPDSQPAPRPTQTWIVYDDGTESMYF
jgi:hypothetical protein